MDYKGYRPLHPGQNWKDWVDAKGNVGNYSNTYIFSPVQLLDDVGEYDGHPQYAISDYLLQMVRGEFEYKPMELWKYNHGGQDAPYLTHRNLEFHGVPSAEVFPEGETIQEAAAATYTMGVPATGARDYSTDSLTFTVIVDGASQGVVLNDTYPSRPALVSALNSAVADASISLDDSDNLVITSLTMGSASTLELTDLVDPLGSSGVENFAEVEGQDLIREGGWGHDGTRVISTSRWSNLFFRGVPSADATPSGKYRREWNTEVAWFGPTDPYVNKGVTGDALDTSEATGKDGKTYAWYPIYEHNGVTKAL